MLMFNYTILLLLSNPVMGWINWYGSAQYEVVNNYDVNVTPPQQLERPDVHLLPTNRTTTRRDATVDILKILNLSLRTPGVAQVTGPILNVPAFKLRPTFGTVQVPNPSAVTTALSNPDGFTLVFVYRQHRKTLGTLLSVHSPGRVTPWFQVTSNLRTGQIILHYRLTTDSKMHQNAWSLKPVTQLINSNHPNSVNVQPKAGGLGWTFVSISLNTTTNKLTMQLGCEAPRARSLAGRRRRRRPLCARRVGAAGRRRGGKPAQPTTGPAPRLNVPDDALVYFRQEPGFKKKFLGTIQVAKVYPYATTEHKEWKCVGNQVVRQLQ